jgi:hypothetical protein
MIQKASFDPNKVVNNSQCSQGGTCTSRLTLHFLRKTLRHIFELFSRPFPFCDGGANKKPRPRKTPFSHPITASDQEEKGRHP